MNTTSCRNLTWARLILEHIPLYASELAEMAPRREKQVPLARDRAKLGHTLISPSGMVSAKHLAISAISASSKTRAAGLRPEPGGSFCEKSLVVEALLKVGKERNFENAFRLPPFGRVCKIDCLSASGRLVMACIALSISHIYRCRVLTPIPY